MIGPQLIPATNPMHFAVINPADNVVVNVILAEPGFDLPDLLLINVDEVRIGQIYNPADGAFMDPAPQPQYMNAALASTAVYDAIDAFTLSVTGRVPDDEKLAWPAKEDAARAIVAGTATEPQTALLADEASGTGETVAALAAKVIAKADVYRAIVARCTAIRRNADTALAAASAGPYDGIVSSAIAALAAING